MRDEFGVFFFRHFDQGLGDAGSGQRGPQKVPALVPDLCLDTGPDVVLHKLLFLVDYVDLFCFYLLVFRLIIKRSFDFLISLFCFLAYKLTQCNIFDKL